MATIEAETEIEAATSFRRHHLSIDRYLAMVEAGVFRDNEQIFLWKGELVEKMTKGPHHSKASTRLYKWLVLSLPEGWYVEQEQPLAMPDDGMPEPDLAVIRGDIEEDADRAAPASKVALIVEVADSSLAVDSGEVLETYAAASIPIYWIVDVRHHRIEVCEKPTGPAEPATYRVRRMYGRGEKVPVVLDGREIGRVAVDAILPGAS